jgi:hypothetical protein
VAGKAFAVGNRYKTLVLCNERYLYNFPINDTLNNLMGTVTKYRTVRHLVMLRKKGV